MAAGDRIGMIECSIRCFLCGLLGLVPLLGLPACVLALIWGVRARRAARRQWNPADLHLALGHGAAIFGLLLSGLVFATLLAAIAYEAFPDAWSGWLG